MNNCPHCSGELPDDASDCPHCGGLIAAVAQEEQPEQTEKRSPLKKLSLSWPLTFWVAEGVGIGGFLLMVPAEGSNALISAAVFAVLAPIAWQVLEWLRSVFPAPPSAMGGPADENILLKHGLQLFSFGIIALLILTQVEAHNQKIMDQRREKIWSSWQGNACVGSGSKGVLEGGCPPISRLGIDP